MSAALATTDRRRVPRPLEGLLVSRYREELAGRVLEIGTTPGRLEPYFVALSSEVTRRAIGELGDEPGASYDAAVATGGVLDSLDRRARRAALAEIARALAPGGLLIKSCPDHAAHRLRGVVSPQLSRDAQERRLAELGFELIECVEVGHGAELLCVARRD